MRTGFIVCLVLGTLLSFSATSIAGVDLEVPSSFKVKGTAAGEDSRDYFHFEATAGTLLSVTAAGRGLDLALELSDPEGEPVPLSGAAKFRDLGKKVSANKLELPRTGLYKLALSSSVAGDYSLKVKGKPAKKAGGTINVPAGESTEIPYSAPDGSTLTLKAKAARKSLAEPRFGEFSGTDLTEQGRYTAKSHTVKLLDVDGGDRAAVLANLGATAGDVVVTIKIKAPRVRTGRYDVRGRNLGNPADGGTALGRNVAADAGGEVVVDDEDSSIDGASVKIEPDAMPEDTTITIASSEPVEPPADRQAAGPTVSFGPPGLTFSKPVEVSVPYDPALVPSEATVDDLRVLHVKSNGDEETLTPVAVDEANHLLRVEMTSFSKVMPIGPKGAASLAGRTFWFVDLFAALEQSFDGDSRGREILGGRGAVTFGPENQDGGAVAGTDLAIDWSHDQGGVGSIGTSQETLSGTLIWKYETGKKSIDLGGEIFDLSSDGGVLVKRSWADNGEEATIAVAVEKSKTAPKPADLAGTWRFVDVEFGVGTSSEFLPNERVSMMMRQTYGTITFKSKGTFSNSATETIIHYPAHGGSWDESETFTESGVKWNIVGTGPMAGAVKIENSYFFPSADRNILIGLNRDSDGGEGLALTVAIRVAGTPSLSGTYRMRGLYIDSYPYAHDDIGGGQSQINDILVTSIRGTGAVSGSNIVFGVDYRALARDTNQSNGLVIDTGTDQSTEALGTSDGFITIDGAKPDYLRGVLTPNSNFGVFHQMKAYVDTGGGEVLQDTLALFFAVK